MSDHNKFDGRVDALVMEKCTIWSDDLPDLTVEDKEWLADALHAKPSLAANVAYDRSHTGFTRTVTVSAEDIERIYNDRMAN